jgi:plastocyanin
MKINRFMITSLLAVTLVSNAACGKASPAAPSMPSSSGNVTAPAQNQPAPQAGYAEINIPGRNFVPDSLTVTKGTTVNWTSRDGEVHTVTSDNTSLFNGTVDPFGWFAYTFNQTGDFEYYCTIHGQMGMRGVIHVK